MMVSRPWPLSKRSCLRSLFGTSEFPGAGMESLKPAWGAPEPALRLQVLGERAVLDPDLQGLPRLPRPWKRPMLILAGVGG